MANISTSRTISLLQDQNRRLVLIVLLAAVFAMKASLYLFYGCTSLELLRCLSTLLVTTSTCIPFSRLKRRSGKKTIHDLSRCVEWFSAVYSRARLSGISSIR